MSDMDSASGAPSRPTLLVVHGGRRPGEPDHGVGRWVADVARAHARFEVRIADLDELVRPARAPATGAPASDPLRPWTAVVEDADALLFVASYADEGLAAPLHDLIDRRDAAWRMKPAAVVRTTDAASERAARALRACLDALGAVAVRGEVVAPDPPDVVRVGLEVAEATLAVHIHDLLDELTRLHAFLRPLRPGRVAADGDADGAVSPEVRAASTRSQE